MARKRKPAPPSGQAGPDVTIEMAADVLRAVRSLLDVMNQSKHQIEELLTRHRVRDRRWRGLTVVPIRRLD